MADILDMKRRLARLLVEKSYKEGQFTLTSGRRSDYYFDGKQTALHPVALRDRGTFVHRGHT